MYSFLFDVWHVRNWRMDIFVFFFFKSIYESLATVTSNVRDPQFIIGGYRNNNVYDHWRVCDLQARRVYD